MTPSEGFHDLSVAFELFKDFEFHKNICYTIIYLHVLALCGFFILRKFQEKVEKWLHWCQNKIFKVVSSFT